MPTYVGISIEFIMVNIYPPFLIANPCFFPMFFSNR